MKKCLLLVSFAFTLIPSFAQQKTTIYLFPGQGSDKRIFDSLTFDPSYAIHYMDYGMPDKGTTIKGLAKILSGQIDTSQKFILIGVSLGGMLCIELNEILNPEKVIIISSAKNRSELPFRYKFQRAVPIYKILPGSFLLLGAKFLQPIVEPDRKRNKETFKNMLGAKDPKYIKRTIDMIIRWDRTSNTKTVTHIHGNNDHTIPIRRVKYDYLVDNGSHMMTLTRFEEINEILKKELEVTKQLQ